MHRQCHGTLIFSVFSAVVSHNEVCPVAGTDNFVNISDKGLPCCLSLSVVNVK